VINFKAKKRSAQTFQKLTKLFKKKLSKKKSLIHKAKSLFFQIEK